MAKICRFFAPLILLLGLPLFAADEDALIRQAHDAWSAHKLPALEKYAARANAAQDSLADYVDYWVLDLRLGQLRSAAVLPEMDRQIHRFQEQHPDSSLVTPLRISWLKTLGLFGDWRSFEQALDVQSLSDREVACLELQRRLNQNDGNALLEVRDLWFKPGYPQAACIPLFRSLQARGMLTEAEAIKPLRRAFASHDPNLIKLINGFLPGGSSLREADLNQAERTPERYLKSLGDGNLTGPRAELVVFALEQQARKSPAQAAETLDRVSARLPSPLRSWAWQQIGRQGALTHDPHALQWFALGAQGEHDDELAGWWLRAALLKQDWVAVQEAFAAMSTEEQKKPAWQYWQAHALLATGEGLKARKLLKQLARENSFYGVLALEAQGKSWAPPTDTKQVEAVEYRELEPALARALRLRSLGQITEARTEWAWLNRKFTPRQRHVAASWAAQNQWYDRAIYSIDRADNETDLALRFPLPERDLLDVRCRDLGMDEAWVYGLMRQESHFVNDAKSHTGAMGLMQLMPATARWVAKKIPLKNFNLKQLSQPEVNVQMGVWFLHHLETVMGNPVLATAGYNGGPGRVARWLASSPADVAIFIETIPFDETRGYVQKVMYNATVYNHRLGMAPISLNQRLGNAGKMRELLQQTDRLEELEELP
jgi:soluble lytic murein transglycosylase